MRTQCELKVEMNGIGNKVSMAHKEMIFLKIRS